MLHALVPADNDTAFPSGAFYISDGNALFHSLTNLPPTMGGICKQVLSIMVEKGDFLFSTDSYHGPLDSVKTSERVRRGVSQRYIIEGPATKRPPDLKLFLSGDENKEQLSELALKVWGSPECAIKLGKVKHALLVVNGKTYEFAASENKVSRIFVSRYNFYIFSLSSVDLFKINSGSLA